MVLLVVSMQTLFGRLIMREGGVLSGSEEEDEYGSGVGRGVWSSRKV